MQTTKKDQAPFPARLNRAAGLALSESNKAAELSSRGQDNSRTLEVRRSVKISFTGNETDARIKAKVKEALKKLGA